MAAVLDTTDSAVFVNTPPSVSFALGSGSGNDRMVVCYIGAEGNVARPTFATPTFNGTDAVTINTDFDGTLRGGVAYWRDADLPATSGTYTITLSITNETAYDGAIHVVSVTGVNQVYVPVITETDIGSSTLDPTCTTANDNSFVFCGFAGVNGDPGAPRTGAVHNSIGNLASGLYDGNAGYALDTGTAGVQTVGWSITGADSWNRGVASAIEFEPAAAGAVAVTPDNSTVAVASDEAVVTFNAAGAVPVTPDNSSVAVASDNVGVTFNTAGAISSPLQRDVTIRREFPGVAGNWIGRYGGTRGYYMPAYNNTTDLDALDDVTVSITGLLRFRWANSIGSLQQRAPQTPDGTSRLMGVFYTATTGTMDLNFGAGFVGDLHIYAADWDGFNRRATWTVDDGKRSKTVAMTATYNPGMWMHFPVDVDAGGTITVETVNTTAGGLENALIGPFFLGEPAIELGGPNG